MKHNTCNLSALGATTEILKQISSFHAEDLDNCSLLRCCSNERALVVHTDGSNVSIMGLDLTNKTFFAN